MVVLKRIRPVLTALGLSPVVPTGILMASVAEISNAQDGSAVNIPTLPDVALIKNLSVLTVKFSSKTRLAAIRLSSLT